jgi:hypothetical protein
LDQCEVLHLGGSMKTINLVTVLGPIQVSLGLDIEGRQT